MSCFFSLQTPKALPSLSSFSSFSSVQYSTKTPFYISSKLNPTNPHKKLASITQKTVDYFDGKGSAFAIQAGALVLATFEQPALAVTGENNYVVDWNIAIIKLGAIAFWYFLIMPAKVVQEKATGNVFSIHVCLLVLSWYNGVGAISKLQEISKGSINEVSMVRTRGSFKN
ncbi:hypothetical protein Ddye_030247 [Dipteronia dyeriana]|uniref:Uncharacterized protein n=1 Tax=Dipteronia dyeriana TaxID=168575 RepID=A0AAD9TH98_9ROSI|nr:hypothetical protein Ddye_030247 [Dipteronia dyeriana]